MGRLIEPKGAREGDDVLKALLSVYDKVGLAKVRGGWWNRALVVGNIVGMAYVVARPKGRFEIRESVHTPAGPRARSLAGFTQLTDEVLAKASRKAVRPFDPEAVRASAARAAAPTPRHRRHETQRFVESSRRMAAALESRPPPVGSRRDPGDALIDLLGLVAQVSAFRPPRAPEPLRFPSLARLRAARPTGTSH